MSADHYADMYRMIPLLHLVQEAARVQLFYYQSYNTMQKDLPSLLPMQRHNFSKHLDQYLPPVFRWHDRHTHEDQYAEHRKFIHIFLPDLLHLYQRQILQVTHFPLQ